MTAKQKELERERAKCMKDQRTKHIKFAKEFCFHGSGTFMDYLHGDVIDDNAFIACCWEYARESQALREAAKRRDEIRAQLLQEGLDSERDTEKAALWALEESRTVYPMHIWEFLACGSFPEQDWNGISQNERECITRFLPTDKVRPLRMTDAWTLVASGTLQRFTKMGKDAKPAIVAVPPGERVKPMELVWPVLHQHESTPFYHAIFTLDFSKGETRLANEFKEWLRLPENCARIEKHKNTRTGKTGKALDRLKDLASWRLYRELGNDWEKANSFASKHRKKAKSSPRAFHNARSQGGLPANDADLFSERADALKAQARAWQHLMEMMPEEFLPPNPYMLDAFIELDRV